MENRPSGSAAGEDIRSKLARYKKEREDFELIRQQFRKKNTELGNSANLSTQQPVGSENVPANRSHSGSNKYSGMDFGGSGNKSSNNIFAVDHSAGTSKVFTTTTHMTSGSPAFGLPEQSQSRDH